MNTSIHISINLHKPLNSTYSRTAATILCQYLTTCNLESNTINFRGVTEKSTWIVENAVGPLRLIEQKLMNMRLAVHKKWYSVYSLTSLSINNPTSIALTFVWIIHLLIVCTLLFVCICALTFANEYVKGNLI